MTETIEKTSGVSRRTFLKGSSLAALAGVGGSALYGCSTPEEEQPLSETGAAPTVAHPAEQDEVFWGTCKSDGCGQTICPLRYHVKDGAITLVEADDRGDGEFGGVQARCCLRGRSMRQWHQHPDRLKWPLKRTGPRGSGQYERISWDEAVQTIAEKLKYTIDTYGNEAIHSGVTAIRNDQALERLLNCLGGYLGGYGSDSRGQLETIMPYMMGSGGPNGSSMTNTLHSDLVIQFGNNPATTRMGGASANYDLARAREKGVEIITIDYWMNDSCVGHPEEWQPIRSGTDAALASAMAYVLISEGAIDEAWVNKYCIGYDESTMPESARGKHLSYKDYIMGTGYDMIPKTPEWAAPITLISAERITELAHKLANAKAAYISQGWGPQRHGNGESTCRAIAMLPIITGNIGRVGCNTGMRDGVSVGLVNPFTTIPGGENPVKTMISCISVVDAVDHGHAMTATRDGVTGADKLSTDIKFLWLDGTNLLNQRGDLRRSHEIMKDENKCEFIVAQDMFMTFTASYADIILPGITRNECASVIALATAGEFVGQLHIDSIVQPPEECRNMYDVCTDIARILGVEEAYTEGRTWAEWQQFSWEMYQPYAAQMPGYETMPTWEEISKDHIWTSEIEVTSKMMDFFADPEAAPLDTESGKIEVYCERLANIAATWELDDPTDVISPIPIYTPGFESYEACTEDYPLYLSGWHPRQRFHSTFHNLENLRQATRQQLLINPADAEPRGIKNGDMVSVTNERGEVHVEARVTPRIIPGQVGMPEGAWAQIDFDGDGIDRGGNINVLCNSHPSPLSKHNCSNSAICQVTKL
ncbi:DMSO/selenate family reductase complex A subunit [Adlercreutzia mucosicola]|uniref:DMSO/selenate family reductase complex A subunit n=1 Tax=Adlercreutzia mucosicola TaxID=580026 RepID=UPI00041D1B31|nr:DMSO/selenate family reductase complex A subunit [Adlercreutzia mucosicola]MCR2034872.1 molybdopterin-dependent oxidoreductase [Adlercreutzia mucosicola]